MTIIVCIILEVMVKFTRRATGHFVMLIETGIYLIMYVLFWTRLHCCFVVN